MKIAITGHSRGIGKAIYEKLQEREGYEFRGYSRPENNIGTDTQKVIDDIVEWDADVVFNNAWSYLNNAQNVILKSLREAWAESEKVIISTGSSSGIYRENPEVTYARDKTELHDIHIKASYTWPITNKTRCHNVSFGYVQTSLLEGAKNVENYISVEDAAQIMIDLIEPRNYLIAEQLITHRYTEWDEHDELRKTIDKNVFKYWV
jgi:NAD(P)-dependent dehydrogenase (short-subunit alcohol dehydrogenase family)